MIKFLWSTYKMCRGFGMSRVRSYRIAKGLWVATKNYSIDPDQPRD